MKKALINKEKLDFLTKKRNKLLIISLFLIFINILIIVITIIFNSRNRMIFFICLDSLITITTSFIIFCYLTEVFIPLNRYIKIIKQYLNSNLTTQELTYIAKENFEETYLNIRCNVIIFSSSEQKKLKLFIMKDEDINLKSNELYKITTYHHLIGMIEGVIK